MNRNSVVSGIMMLVATFSITIGTFSSGAVVFAQDIKVEKVSYGEAFPSAQILDVYQPAPSDTPLPAVILIHGGGGSFGDGSDFKEHSQALAEAGYVAFNIEYRLLQGTKNSWPTQFEDAQLAVRWIRANASKYNVDPDRICALGHSFGGQLAALLGERDTPTTGDVPLSKYSSRVACVIDIAGSVDPSQPLKDAGAGLDVALYGNPDENPEVYKNASALIAVNSKTVPFLIFHGTDDEVVPVEESRLLADALHKAGVYVIYAEMPQAKHFYWLNFFKGSGSWSLVGPETLAFLARNLQPAS